ncbi:sigma-70 family RNA polymerase sigma factor [Paroceanicella profunda]|uniref:Sigma-70 family RNA polymerase sigma factor n=1 Tax=Paroceanicella profunda TaxID=2579971 RepID=A0A5B8FSH7_9RHOB|nr:sigma-70 family RNA polymerase sigma factor [Paroceanicella profunda]QDL91335.1 sigma-70 family RNA polymerase sigma factor [Paroceanicella profunda]
MAAGEDDRTVLSRAALGDKAAMRVLYERHHDPLHAFLRARCRDEALASDVVHDAMLEVWRSAGRFSGKSSVRTWIFAIARNKLVDRLRRGGALSFVEEVPDLPDEAPDAEAVLDAAQNAARVRACLDRLKAMHLAVIRLAFYEGLPYDEISRVEGIPVGTVKTRIFHAKQALLHCLGRRR